MDRRCQRCARDHDEDGDLAYTSCRGCASLPHSRRYPSHWHVRCVACGSFWIEAAGERIAEDQRV